MWVTAWECGSPVTNYPRAAAPPYEAFLNAVSKPNKLYSKNPRIRTSTFKNQQQRVFSVILPESVGNGCLDKFLLISTYPLHSMFIYLLYQLRTKHGKLYVLIHGFLLYVIL